MGMFERASILGLYSITPVHAGSGTELSVIDLPIQRERHTGFPVIWGQSLKGVLRSYFRRLELDGKIEVNGMTWKWGEKVKEICKENTERYIEMVKEGKRDPPLTEIIFGRPSTDAASEHAGVISVGDAKILLFPVRSAKGVFGYVTCPEVIKRFARDLEFLAEINGKKELKQISQSLKSDKLTELEDSKAIAGEALVFDNEVVLEDVVLEAEADNENLNNIANSLKIIFGEKVDNTERIFGINFNSLRKRIAIVSNDIFRYFVKFSTEIVARVRIDAEKGTVAQGGLWYEEFLPSDTLMYSTTAIGKPRGKVPKDVSRSEDVAKILRDVLRGKYIQVGGDETVGKGFVKVTVWGEIDGSENA